MKTMRGASGSSGAKNFLVSTKYGAGILQGRIGTEQSGGVWTQDT